MATEERAGVDLFVNGRLRERDILKHIPTAQIAESYLYGQVPLMRSTMLPTGSQAAAKGSSLMIPSTQNSSKSFVRRF